MAGQSAVEWGKLKPGGSAGPVGNPPPQPLMDRLDSSMIHPSGTRELYQSSATGVRFEGDLTAAEAFYRRYVTFVCAHLPRHPSRVLEVGCGSGWTAAFLRRAGHEAYGVDLHHGPLGAFDFDREISYASADAARLPFADGSFDAVGMYQVLEHLPDPARALEECRRVLRPGGRLVVVGPHLVSLGVAAYSVAKEVVKALRRGGLWERRGPATPIHPYGNTLPETLRALGRTFAWNVRQVVARAVTFPMRQPDPRPPFLADNDACYFCNPMDLLRWAGQTRDMRLVRWWPLDRPFARLLWRFGGGTWVVLERAGGG